MLSLVGGWVGIRTTTLRESSSRVGLAKSCAKTFSNSVLRSTWRPSFTSFAGSDNKKNKWTTGELVGGKSADRAHAMDPGMVVYLLGSWIGNRDQVRRGMHPCRCRVGIWPL
ncbi:hypothetical protein CLAIMM_06331 [Cladophialophora immunda]|nr:hypothetical protein CLAIMM_06331 [Cladophialophora immunda]